MIKLYTYESNEDKIDSFYRTYNDIFNIFVMKDTLDSRDAEIIEGIDGVKYLGNDKIETKLGDIINVEYISTGAKIALIIKWLIKHNRSDIKLDISHCGDNVYPFIIKEVGDTDIEFITCNYSVSCKDKVNIIVNDKYHIDSFYGLMNLNKQLYKEWGLE